MTRHLKPLILIVLLATAAGLAFVFPVRDWLVTGLDWIDTHRSVAWLVYVVVYVVATVLLVPGSILTLAAGFFFGLLLGVVVVSAGSVIGATCAFVVGRFFVRDWVAQRTERLPKFRALDKATAHDGFTVVLLARLSPLFPFNLLNYALALTSVRLEHYVVASWIGMLPATILYVYVGTLAASLATIASGDIETGLAGRALLALGFLATVALTVIVTRRATRALGAELEAADEEIAAEGRARPASKSGRAADGTSSPVSKAASGVDP